MHEYQEARRQAQAIANQTGFDVGLERNELFGTWSWRMLPAAQYRAGHELRVEVVSCENLEKCQKGHGPGVR